VADSFRLRNRQVIAAAKRNHNEKGMYFHLLTTLAKMQNRPIVSNFYTKISTSLPVCCLTKYCSGLKSP
jgi:hypothetical protein